MATFDKKLFGTSKRPRISVFRSNRYVSAQAIDDEKGVTIAAVSTQKTDAKKKPIEKAKDAGISLAKTLSSKKISEAVFDRNSKRYHGQVKSLAEGIREGGIKV